jgi:2-oxoglutarate dehydrogenase E1 component
MSEGPVATCSNVEALEALYTAWRANPESVDPSWRLFFEGFDLGMSRPTPEGTSHTEIVRLIYAYRTLGHHLAHLDPLNEPPASIPLLELSEFGLTQADLDRLVYTSPFIGLQARLPLRDLITALRETYCRKIGVEYMHIQNTRVRRWLQERMEPIRNRPRYDRERKIRVLKSLHYAELFERFLHTRYTGQKRFSLEGAETLIPLLDAIVDRAPDLGAREIILGMAHRGRLNVLANILRKPYEEIFAQFEDKYLPDSAGGDGDVKYHLGFSSDRVNSHGALVHVSLSPNPSHLEAVDPVVEGRVRAKQTLFGDTERKRGLPILVHGDAAFAGQGLVAETLNLSQLDGYTTGGTIHVIVNNQIGFTTNPCDARSTLYCTDIGKMIQAPIFHVNGEDPEAVAYLAELALEFRQTFKQDVIIDMFCYRKYGHNEGDDPSYTQPIMYSRIKGRLSPSSVYTETLIMTGDLTVAETEAITNHFQEKLQESLEEVKTGPACYPTMHGFDGQWKGMTSNYSHDPVMTGVDEKVLQRIGDAMLSPPEGFRVNPKITHLFQEWRRSLEKGDANGEKGKTAAPGIPWAFGEALAFGSLVLEGYPVRLSGQDCRRGTFSQRHAALFDTETGRCFVPLSNLDPEQAPFTVLDSMLSEAAVLGFEFGYSLDSPQTLVLWEAQFGDFANGAQVIIDQFVVSSESKWQRDSGLVMLLPHGYEGQGPEHSSARLERYLQLCAEDNIQVVYPSTPAQYFHVLRRQMKRNFRKPLVVMTPKSLLRDKMAVSPMQDLVTGRFLEVIDDAEVDPGRMRRVVFCSGKVYYDLLKQRTQDGMNEVAVVRVEQLYPFPEEQIRRVLTRYGKGKVREWVWAQEESQNMGAWSFIEPRMRALDCEVRYVGRDASASPATGSLQVHVREQKELVEAALRGSTPHLVRATSANGHTRPAGPPAQARAAESNKYEVPSTH